MLKTAQTAEEMKDKTKKDKKESKKNLYSKIEGISEREITQLCNLDKDIERLFEIQMRKNNKNDEMIRNKINDLNEKPSLRNYLFKKVSEQELQKDLTVMKREVLEAFRI